MYEPTRPARWRLPHAIGWFAYLLVLLSAVTVQAAAPSSDEAREPDCRVLLVTGEDYPGHPWKETAPQLRDCLAEDPRIETRIVEDFNVLEAELVHDYDVLVLHFKNYEPARRPERLQENLRRFLREGGGLVLTHFACGAFQEWPEFRALAGRTWDPELRGHDPFGPFEVRVVEPDHPITRGLEDFVLVDELYTCTAGNDVDTLLAATSKVDNISYPIVFTFSPEPGGRVCQNLLGHNAAVYGNPHVAQLSRRIVLWAAGLDHPTAQKMTDPQNKKNENSGN